MTSVKIYGAGSIGNHLAHACRGMGWQVLVCDTDPEALVRTRESIYPQRYGQWDEQIRLANCAEESSGQFDVVFIGTPPPTHVALAREAIERHSPRIVMLEKPACDLSMEGVEPLLAAAQRDDVFLGIGYNHILTPNTVAAGSMLAEERIGQPLTIAVRWVEHWGGIFAAHPWLTGGPAGSYLGYAEQGGGACGEHSHGINLWQHFAHLLGCGRVLEVTAVMDRVQDGPADYDRLTQLSLVTEGGLVGYVVQDVMTQPPIKQVRIQGRTGYVDWRANHDDQHDSAGVASAGGEFARQMFAKCRADDFRPQIEHLDALLADAVGYASPSPITLERGLDTMLVIVAAHRAAALKTTMRIDYDRGYSPGAVAPVACMETASL